MQLYTNKSAEFIQFIKAELSGKYPSEELSAFVFILFEAYLGWDKTKVLLSDSTTTIPESTILKFLQAVKRLKKYEPIQYVLGYTEFYGLRFEVNPSVLIPRPETEELVHWILNETPKHTNSIIDLCTGSGCIALSLKKHLPASKITGIDIDNNAIATAQKNAACLHLEVDFICADIFSFLPNAQFELIVSNPPYVRESEKNLMQANVLDYEPEKALFIPDNQALMFYEKIADFAKQYLLLDGFIYLEINEFLSAECQSLFYDKGFSFVEIKQDMNGKNRMMKIRK